MNVIVANKYKDELSNLEIDVIKRLDGEFDIETIVDTFANFYFNRMILDITALKDSFNIGNIQRLSASLDASKIILLLNDDPRINNSFLSKIISLGIYNFARDITGVIYLMSNPNSYRDVAQYHDLAASEQQNLKNAKGGLFGGFAPNMNTNNNQNNNNMNNMEMQGFNNNPNQQQWMGQNQNMGMNPGFNQGYSPNGGFNQAQNFGSNQAFNVNPGFNQNSGMGNGPKIIGFKDLTPDAGATTLVYMLKKNLNKRKVLAVEINNNDFSYFGDNELMSVPANNIGNVRNKFNQFEIVLVDLNNSNLDTDGTCTDVIYLLEPSTIKLNALLRKDRNILDRIKDKKIVLNKSLLDMNDVKEFEYEAKVKVFYNIPPLDERKDSQMALDSFLEKLGIFTDNGNGGAGGIFSIFKK